MAFTVLTEDPAVREVGDLIIVDDRVDHADVLGLFDDNFADEVEEQTDTQESEMVDRSDADVGHGDEEEGGDEEEDDEEVAEGEDDDTESERS
jgi:hypothetical protein